MLFRSLPIADFLILTLLQTLAALISIGGVGTRDAVLVAFLDRYGYSGGQAIAISFLILGLNLVNILPGFLFWLRDPLPRGKGETQEMEGGGEAGLDTAEVRRERALGATGER